MAAPDTNLLRTFVFLAQTGSFTKTAKLMHVSQSAVSHGMKRLESQVGCALLHKKGKATHLTPEGQLFLTQVQRGLDTLERAVDALNNRFADARGTLNVMFAASMAHLILAPVLREFRESYPHISVSVRLEDTPPAVLAIEEGRCDLALVVEDQIPKSLKAHVLFQDQLQFVCSPIHPWAEKSHPTAADISKEHFLLYRRQSVTFRRAEDFFLRIGARLHSYVEIPSFEIMKQMAQLGLGVALMAPWVARKEIEEGSLITKPLPRFPIDRKWVILHQANRGFRPPEQTFVGLCRLACEKMARDIPNAE